TFRSDVDRSGLVLTSSRWTAADPELSPGGSRRFLDELVTVEDGRPVLDLTDAGEKPAERLHHEHIEADIAHLDSIHPNLELRLPPLTGTDPAWDEVIGRIARRLGAWVVRGVPGAVLLGPADSVLSPDKTVAAVLGQLDGLDQAGQPAVLVVEWPDEDAPAVPVLRQAVDLASSDRQVSVAVAGITAAAFAMERLLELEQPLERMIRVPLLGWSVSAGGIVADAGPAGHSWWLEFDGVRDIVLGTVDPADGFRPARVETLAAEGDESTGDLLTPVDAPDPVSGRSFGLEIEFIGANPLVLPAMAALLYQLGLATSPVPTPIHEQEPDYTAWSVHAEDGYLQFEVVSRVLADSPEAWGELRSVLRAVTAFGGAIDRTCGGHIHVGAAEFSGDRDLQERLIRVVAAHEDMLFRLGADHLLGHRGQKVAQALTLWPEESVPDTRSARILHAQSLNLDHLALPGSPACAGPSPDHVEFRIADATLDLGTIQMRVRVDLALLDAAASMTPTAEQATSWAKVDVFTAKPTGLGYHASQAAELSPERAGGYDREVLDDFLRLLGDLDPRVRDQIIAYFELSAWLPAMSR
ncbi:MAG: hypothetical protein ACRCYQ_07890, partial [Nocardioides sp.]